MEDSPIYTPGEIGATIAPALDNLRAFSNVMESRGVSLRAMINFHLSFNATCAILVIKLSEIPDAILLSVEIEQGIIISESK